jgi:hypothetical protein
VLEPDEFTARFREGPEDRRGNKWKEFLAECEADGIDGLTSGDYADALAVRDALKNDAIIRRLTGEGTVREVSAFATDPETGIPCRMRADAFAPASCIIADLKTTDDARIMHFGRRVAQLGYHVQEAHYTDTWKLAKGQVEMFVFVVVEPTAPFAFKVYELDADAVAEGRAVRRKALDRWAQCVETGLWPAYDSTPEPLRLRDWDFTETAPLRDA